MNIKTQIENCGNAVLMVTANDLQEFALSLINEAKNQVCNEEELLTATEFCKKNRISKATLWRWVQAGVMKQTKIGTKVFYQQSDLKFREGEI